MPRVHCNLRIVIFVPLALAATAVAAWQPAHASALSLREAVQYTINNNPLIKAAEANRRATGHELRQSQARLLPNVSLDGDAGRENIDRPQGFAPGVNDVWRTRRQASVTMRQVLFDGWEIANAIYRDAARVDGAALRALSRSEALALSAVEAFIDVHRQRRVLIIALRNVTRHQRYFSQVRAKQSGGKSGIGEVQQVQERLTAAKSALLRIKQSLADAISKFNSVVGMQPEHLIAPVVPTRLPGSRQAAVDLGIRNNPSIRAANADIDAARLATEGSRSSYYPKVAAELKGSYGNDLSGTPGPSRDLSGRVVLNWNLFSGGARRARTNELAERMAEAMAVRDARIRDVTDAIDRAFAAIRIGAESVRTNQQQAAIAARVVSTYEEEFKLSKRSLLDLLDSESSRFSADIQLIGARSLLAFAKYRILGAAGTLIRHFGIAVSEETIANQRETIGQGRHGLFSVDLPRLSK